MRARWHGARRQWSTPHLSLNLGGSFGTYEPDGPIGNLGAAALGKALETNTTLTSLCLFANSIGDSGTASLLKALTDRNSTLMSLNLRGNYHISETIRSAIAAFEEANRRGIRLLQAGVKLNLSSKGIDNANAKIIAAELVNNTTVTTLVLKKNEIGHLGCVDIADTLVTNSVLTSIKLNENLFGDAGCTAMATMLLRYTVLTKILLNGNRIGPVGAIALAEMLRVSTSLRELGLGQNNVGNDGTASIADAL
jgi:Ran GTPase-activating protein (RanGAP) involved in mRNA processing and transport